MAVLVEAISVIVRMDRLDAVGTWDDFKALLPNDTLCADTELVRVGFTSPAEARGFVDLLQSHGLRFNESGPAVDIVICDQQRGFTTECRWAEFGLIDLDRDPNKPTASARLTESKVKTMATPIGWTWENSLTREFLFLPLLKPQTSSDCFLSHRDGIREIEILSSAETENLIPRLVRRQEKKRGMLARLWGRD